MDDDYYDFDQLLEEQEEILNELKTINANTHKPLISDTGTTNLLSQANSENVYHNNINQLSSKKRKLSDSDKTVLDSNVKRSCLELNNDLLLVDNDNDDQTRTLLDNKEISDKEIELETVISVAAKKKLYFHVNIPSDQFISFTGSLGRTFYLNIDEEVDCDNTSCILSKDKSSLSILNALDVESRNELHEQAFQERKSRFANLLARDSLHEMDNNVTESESVSTSLWVDKYSPKTYFDLLSDEQTNRQVLSWLKSWNKVAFGKENIVLDGLDGNLLPVQANYTYKLKGKPVEEFSIPHFDNWNRPHYKVILLSGAPGRGKTTLAHILARMAGYNVIEMNASDDRSVELFKQRIEAVTQSQGSIISNSTNIVPNCLIIDEIDGAPAAAIDVLVRSVKSVPDAKEKKRGVLPLLRPIICICNDLFVPSLAKLRPLALVIRFPETSLSILTQRLWEITAAEQLEADKLALSHLAEKSERDIRSCLNTLQFFKSQNKEEFTLKQMESMSFGSKNIQKTLFDVWSAVFQSPLKSKNAHNRCKGASATNTNLLDICQSVGEYDKLIAGLFDNYLKMKVRETHLKAFAVASDWLCFSDKLFKLIGITSDFSLHRFTPFIFVIFRILFGSTAKTNLSYPTSLFDCHQRLTKSVSCLSSVTSDMSAGSRLSNLTLATDVLPHLVRILQPALRPVNTQLYSMKEKLDLKFVVDAMITYNLVYRQERSPEGSFVYVLEPRIDEVALFDGSNSVRQGLTYAAKQLISREVELERMRRSESSLNRSGVALGAFNASHTEATRQPKSLHESIRQVTRKAETAFVSKDFFGRVITPKPVTKESQESELQANPLNNKIWFKYSEGFSDAIKRPVKMKMFMSYQSQITEN